MVGETFRAKCRNNLRSVYVESHQRRQKAERVCNLLERYFNLSSHLGHESHFIIIPNSPPFLSQSALPTQRSRPFPPHSPPVLSIIIQCSIPEFPPQTRNKVFDLDGVDGRNDEEGRARVEGGLSTDLRESGIEGGRIEEGPTTEENDCELDSSLHRRAPPFDDLLDELSITTSFLLFSQGDEVPVERASDRSSGRNKFVES